MSKTKALKAYRSLVDFENEVSGDETDPGWNEPRFDVQLTASSESSRADETYGQTTRTWRIGLTFSKSAWLDGSRADALRTVLAIADDAGAEVSVQGDGLELTWR